MKQDVREQPELNLGQDDGISNLRDVRDIMSMPFFAVPEKGRPTFVIRVQLNTEKDKSYVDIKGTSDGVADMYDKRILLYARMMLDQRRKFGDEPSRTLIFSPHDYFRAIGKKRPSQKDYDAFEKSLDRLKGTFIKSSVDADLGDGEFIRGNMRRGWIDEADYIEHRKPTGIIRRGVRIKISEWLYGLWMMDGQTLSVPRQYFEISSPITMRLYELCRKFVGHQRVPVRMNLELLHWRMNGGSGRPTDLKARIRGITKAGGILGYMIELEEHRSHTPSKRVIVKMTNLLTSSLRTLK